ncbi:MAG: helix-turn-helix domain-containing protein [Ruminiclostridium sp.]
MRNPYNLYDFKVFGQAIKAARESRGWTREVLAEKVNFAPRYIMSIENKGPHISVGQFFFPDTGAKKAHASDSLKSNWTIWTKKILSSMEATTIGISEAKQAEE